MAWRAVAPVSLSYSYQKGVAFLIDLHDFCDKTRIIKCVPSCIYPSFITYFLILG